MRILLLIVATVFAVVTNAQVTKVSLQASGLTCSMCSNSINKALKTIDFVEKVKPDIKTSSFEISFKQGSDVDFDRLKKKVEDAGFTVSNFVATINFNNTLIKNNQPIKIGDKTLQFVNVKEQALNGAKQVRVVDKGFVSTKEYKKSNLVTVANGRGIYNVTI